VGLLQLPKQSCRQSLVNLMPFGYEPWCISPIKIMIKNYYTK
jgi:hypothetical protein